LDDGRFDEWIVLFDEDVVFTVMGNRLRGRDEVRSFIEPTQQEDDRGRHMLSEPVIDVDGDTALAATDYVFVSRTNTILSTGRYVDVIRRAPDRWRFASREIVFSGEAPLGVDG
ncbi:MAG: nuclear transport factor 2 family protein, partial [Actinomycetota bacterium]|nr:nuclear transport factor 2 family protein [Actinomycetota bacterium]MEC8873392.1 nuclear transport factor 2 family protein [Actinomycetota bacterium]MEC8971241.1 nuclear transport factor 2 family protein [Actinomycetota bacterium]